MAIFHEEHPTVALELTVTRHPFSFLSDYDGEMLDALTLKKRGTWKERLLDYTHGDENARDMAMAGMKHAGSTVGIAFDYECYIDRQPVDSQRMLLYAANNGKQEAYVAALSKRHFTMGSSGESASKRHTVLAAAREAGLDPTAAAAFYDSEELRDVVWRSYGDMPKRGINAIPLFVFNLPELAIEGGPLRPHATGHTPPIVNGSMTIDLFVSIFDQLWDALAAHRKNNLGHALKTTPPPKQLPPTPPAPPAPRATDAPHLPDPPLVGHRVVVRGLSARAELNGQLGLCARYDHTKGRCVVRLDGARDALLLRPTNLKQATSADEANAKAAKAKAVSAAAPPSASAPLEDDDDDYLTALGF